MESTIKEDREITSSRPARSNAAKLWRAILALAALACLGVGFGASYFKEPVVILGMPSDLGRIDGDKPVQIRVGFLNLLPNRHIQLRDLGCGCNMDEPKNGIYTLNGIGTVWMNVTLNTNRLPVGRGSQTILVSGFVDERPFSFTRQFSYTVNQKEVPGNATASRL